MNFEKFIRTLFLTEHFRWLLLLIVAVSKKCFGKIIPVSPRQKVKKETYLK